MTSKVLKFVFLLTGIALFLCTCIAPVDTKEFLEDEEVGDAVKNGGGGLSYEEDFPSEYAPKFTAPGLSGTGTKEDPYTLTLSLSGTGKPQSAIITITNANNAYGTTAPTEPVAYSSIRWRCEDNPPLQTDTAPYVGEVTFTADTANAPFDNANSYLVSIQGRLDISYSTAIKIVVID